MAESGIERCTRCGVCRRVCLAEKLGGHTITSMLSGGEEYSAWLCSCCMLCQQVCPEGVDIHQVIVDERRKGQPTEAYLRNLQHVLRCGYSFAISDEINELRAAHGLGPVELVSQERLRLLLTGLRGAGTATGPDVPEGER
jgi:Fe-S oxidoreductase